MYLFTNKVKNNSKFGNGSVCSASVFFFLLKQNFSFGRKWYFMILHVYWYVVHKFNIYEANIVITNLQNISASSHADVA